MPTSSRTRTRTPPPARPLASAPWVDAAPPAVRRELELPALSARETPLPATDIAVVGGGVAGLSAALAAREAGALVTVLEAAPRLGLGATGQNAGILSAGINTPLVDLPPDSPEAAMWPATTALLLGLVELSRCPGAVVAASLTGALSLATSRTAARHLAREARARTAVGVRAEMWEPDQVAARTGGRLRTAGVQAALWLPDEGRLDPVSLLAELARQARAAGVVFVGDARVQECEERRPPEAARGGWCLRLEGAPALEARGLVLADGPTLRATARIYAMAFAADFPDDFPLFWDAAPYVYYDYRPGGGRLGISGGRYARAGTRHRDAHHHARMAEAARAWLPELADRAPTHAWAVDLAVAPGMLPRTRELGNWAPGMAVEGLGALGVLPGMYHGRRAGASVARRAQ